MSEVGAYEAKTRFSEILERASRGERIALTRRGERVAYLIPAGVDRPAAETVDEIREFREAHRLGGELRAAMEEGRL